MTSHAYDGHLYPPQGLLTNVPVSLLGKTVLINIEVVEAQLKTTFCQITPLS